MEWSARNAKVVGIALVVSLVSAALLAGPAVAHHGANGNVVDSWMHPTLDDAPQTLARSVVDGTDAKEASRVANDCAFASTLAGEAEVPALWWNVRVRYDTSEDRSGHRAESEQACRQQEAEEAANDDVASMSEAYNDAARAFFLAYGIDLTHMPEDHIEHSTAWLAPNEPSGDDADKGDADAHPDDARPDDENRHDDRSGPGDEQPGPHDEEPEPPAEGAAHQVLHVAAQLVGDDLHEIAAGLQEPGSKALDVVPAPKALEDTLVNMLGWTLTFAPEVALPEGPPVPQDHEPASVAAPAPVEDGSAIARAATIAAAAVALSAVVALGTASAASGQSVPALLKAALKRRSLMPIIGALPLFSKIAKKDVLDHPLRQAIVHSLHVEPGQTVQDLRARFDVGYGTLSHHVRTLEQNDFVTAAREGRHRRLFLVGQTDASEKERAALLANTHTARVFETVQKSPGASQKAIAEKVQIGASTVHWHMRRLVDAGLVTASKEGRSVRYFPDACPVMHQPSSVAA